MSDPTRTDKQKPARKHSQARRKLLGSLALGGGAAVTATVLPTRWVKPVVDTIEVPLHAQASPGPGGTIVSTMACTLTIGDETFSDGTHVASASLPFGDVGDALDGNSDTDSDSILDIDAISVTVDPIEFGVPVHLDIEKVGTDPANDATLGDGPSLDGDAADPGSDVARIDQDATTDDASVASFVDARYRSGNDGDAAQGFTATFSAPGFTDCVITVTFPTPP